MDVGDYVTRPSHILELLITTRPRTHDRSDRAGVVHRMEAQGPAPQAAAGAGDAAAPPLYYPYQRAGFGVRYDGRGVRRRGCVADDAETLLSAYLRDVALDQSERIRGLEQTLTLERQRWQQQHDGL
eukprot:SAG25_NODE_3029_length_1260_cov_2.814815_2_plen_126_part_01